MDIFRKSLNYYHRRYMNPKKYEQIVVMAQFYCDCFPTRFECYVVFEIINMSQSINVLTDSCLVI